MGHPRGFIVSGQKNEACKLLRSLYGLNQEPRECHENFDSRNPSIWLKCDFVKCVYVKTFNNFYVILSLYVDYILILEKHIDIIHNIKNFMSDNSYMKDLSKADMILGNKLLGSCEATILNQSQYVENLLRRFLTVQFKPVSSPYDPNMKLKENCERVYHN